MGDVGCGNEEGNKRKESFGRNNYLCTVFGLDCSAVTLPISKFTHKLLSGFVLFYAVAVLGIIAELAFVELSVGFSEGALAVTLALQEVALVCVAIGPGVSAVAVGFAMLVLAHILVAVVEFLLPLAMLQKITEVATVLGTTTVHEASLAGLLVLAPLALIGVALRRAPLSEAILAPLSPFTIEFLSIVPYESPLATAFAFMKLSRIDALPILLVAAHLRIIVENPFKELSLRDKYALPLTLLPSNLSEVHEALS